MREQQALELRTVVREAPPTRCTTRLVADDDQRTFRTVGRLPLCYLPAVFRSLIQTTDRGGMNCPNVEPLPFRELSFNHVAKDELYFEFWSGRHVSERQQNSPGRPWAQAFAGDSGRAWPGELSWLPEVTSFFSRLNEYRGCSCTCPRQKPPHHRCRSSHRR